MTAYGTFRTESEKTASEEAIHRQVQEKKEKRAKLLQQVRERRKVIQQSVLRQHARSRGDESEWDACCCCLQADTDLL